MFERYTEKARRVIFFARYEASQYGSRYIETEHLLLGLLREDRLLTRRFLAEDNALAEIRAEVERHITRRQHIAPSVEIPLTVESKRVLQLAAEEADGLGHRYVGTEHILLALLHLEGSLAGKILHARGVTLPTVREQFAKVSDAARIKLQSRSSTKAPITLESFLAGLQRQTASDLNTFFAQNAQFVDVHGKRWNREEISKEFDTLFAPYAKKNAGYTIEEILADTGDLLVVIVQWHAMLASLERVWLHRMSVVLVPQGDDWAILLAQVTPVNPK